jgi:hypothetical protein
MVKGDVANPHLEGLQAPNGVLWHKENLYVLDKGGLYRVEYDRKLTKLVDGWKEVPMELNLFMIKNISFQVGPCNLLCFRRWHQRNPARHSHGKEEYR